MARIAGVELPNQKRVEIGLTYIYGIGRTTSNQILAKTGIDPDIRCKDLSEDDVSKLRDEIENSHKVEGSLRSEVALDIENGRDWLLSWRQTQKRLACPRSENKDQRENKKR